MRRFLPFLVSMALFLAFVGMVSLSVCQAQSVMPLPTHSSNYSGNSRGMWFTAPTSFVITGVRAPLDINTNPQSVHLVKFTTAPPAYSATTTAFTTLYYGVNIATTTFIPLSIQVNTGDIIGILAVRNNGSTGGITSYGPAGPYTSSIGPYPVTLQRLGWQGSILTSPAIDFWTEAAGALGRAEIQYVFALPTDASLQNYINVGDSLCAGNQQVSVLMKNHGPNSLNQAQINWKVNNVAQPPFAWSGQLAVDSTTIINLGTFNFTTGTAHDIVAYLSGVNNNSDSVQTNDTIQKAGIFIKAAPSVNLIDTVVTICQGDSAQLQGTFLGIPPWNFKVSYGTSTIPFTGYNSAAFSYWVNPTSSTAYYFKELSDGSGCAMSDSVKLQVLVSPQPPATITPTGSTAACFGDSVSLMASVGLNFTYNWFKEGVQVPGYANYVFHAKESGNYTVQVVSPNGCKKTSAPQAVIIHPLPVVNLGNDTTLQPGQTLPLNVGSSFYSYLWSTGSTIPMVTIDSTGTGIGVKTVWVVVTDNNGCKGSDTLKINFTNNPGIADPLNGSTFSLTPNPTSGLVEINLTGSNLSSLSVEIYFPDGRLVYQAPYKPVENTIRLNLMHLASGQYLVKITSDKGTLINRLVIRK